MVSSEAKVVPPKGGTGVPPEGGMPYILTAVGGTLMPPPLKQRQKAPSKPVVVAKEPKIVIAHAPEYPSSYVFADIMAATEFKSSTDQEQHQTLT